VDSGYASKLWEYEEIYGFAGPFFSLQTFAKKISGHYILWSANLSRLKISRYIPK
jgi:hypothetical protein